MKHNARLVRFEPPAVPTGPSSRRRQQSPARRRGKKKTSVGTPCPTGARPVHLWVAEPIFDDLVQELAFDPRDVMPV